MKIVHMIVSLMGGGAERQLATLAPELARRGHDVHVAFVRSGVHAGALESSRCTVHHLAAGAKFDPRLPLQALSLLRRLKPDLVQTWLPHMDVVGGPAARMLRIPWILSERSTSLAYPPAALNQVRVFVGRRADRIIANSRGGAEYWERQGVDAARIEVVPNFVPAPDLGSAPLPDDPRLQGGDELLLHVGRLSAEKNLAVLIEAMRHVVRARPQAKLVFCGDGPLHSQLTAQVQASGLSDRVLFAGFVPDVGPWLKRAGAAVAVSLFEGHPNAVLEAMAAEVPLVVSDIPAFRALLDDQSASFVPGEDAGRIAAAIVSTLMDRDEALQRAGRARLAVVPLTLEASATRYEEIYGRTIDRSRTKP